jgi:hypothetical protein
VPESFGKRQRNTARARKVAAREERRLERKQRDADRAAGLIEPGTPIEANEEEDALVPAPAAPGPASEADTDAQSDGDTDTDSDTHPDADTGSDSDAKEKSASDETA